jgi:hypothetical protein
LKERLKVDYNILTMQSVKVSSRGGKEITFHIKDGFLDHISSSDRLYGLDSIVIELWTITEILRGEHQHTFRASQLWGWPDDTHRGVLRKIIREFPDRGVVFKEDEIRILA